MPTEKTFDMKLNCRFCRIGAGEMQLDYDRVLMESEDYYAIASVGGFVEGWTLVCAKRHVLNLSSDYRKAAFHTFASKVADAVTDCYGNVVVFEHGVNRHASLTGCGTDHAHMHLVPFNGNFSDVVKNFAPERKWTATTARDIAPIAVDQEYLMMANSFEEFSSSTYLSIVDKPESQFFRKALASHAGMVAQADYRLFPYVERTQLTAEKLSAIAHEQHSALT